MSNDIKGTLQKLWNGDLPLVQTFWLYYFVTIIVLRILVGLINPALAILIVLWAGFMVMPIWRAASKYSGNSIFAILAKIAAVVVALGVLGSIL